MKITTVIVDDEPLARQRICGLLNEITEIEIVEQCRNGKEAIEVIHSLKPDLVFLDIQMPGIDGFGVLDQLEKLPVVIFVTAYDQYAMQAFDYHAIDYLLKPYKDARFYEALSYAIKQIQLQNLSGIHQKLESLRSVKRDEPIVFQGLNFEIKHQGITSIISSNQIDWINAGGNYVELHCKNKMHLYRSTISTLEFDLQKNGFIRIHRSILIRKSAIKRVSYLNSNNQYRFTLQDGEKLLSARSYKERVVEFLELNSQLLS
ncbi:LytR/AlgR family response regulator transcription factor [Pseudoalteromonas denitrificans]|uniref:Two component transcriptional regulator, LytTR family n=1 Tax=Pseudoalteromonas denitrificans DSM 6059 TaxID=1123010 RepID=A0A1I1KAI1_9GAMM|nr:response regulator [Pseudoalteromonas denitrificans]SFC57766.1 two component transcriptional regulator, LytTR family [Pseudoalteromonas denitrificans DSM 6059]